MARFRELFPNGGLFIGHQLRQHIALVVTFSAKLRALGPKVMQAHALDNFIRREAARERHHCMFVLREDTLHACLQVLATTLLCIL